MSIIYMFFVIGLNLTFWFFVIRWIVNKTLDARLRKGSDSNSQQHYDALQREQALRMELQIAQARAADAERCRMEIDTLVALPAPSVPVTRSNSIDLSAVETAAYGIVMQAHEEGWIDDADFAVRAAQVARKSERETVPAVAIAKHAADLRARGGFGRA